LNLLMTHRHVRNENYA